MNYAQRITLYDVEGNLSSRQHVDKFDEFIDMEEVDYEDVKMRLFTQILFGEAKKWFRDFLARSFPTFKMHFKKGRMIIRVHHKCCLNIRISRKGVLNIHPC